jgi:hypothetical protein
LADSASSNSHRSSLNRTVVARIGTAHTVPR